ncbi:hypothetical protein QVD17_37175 [Tagetes erecta]|uniref:Uncharacterized protein n=1 Tax=Tagetes erecta TaxID=13708 RepID=A0AAD8JVI3_TARER|nr:hypothetical protein QVD17_37175 [Tagetes erecta]
MFWNLKHHRHHPPTVIGCFLERRLVQRPITEALRAPPLLQMQRRLTTTLLTSQIDRSRNLSTLLTGQGYWLLANQYLGIVFQKPLVCTRKHKPHLLQQSTINNLTLALK